MSKGRRLYYLTPVRMEEMPNAGIRKKVWGQLDACRALGYLPILVYLRRNELVLTDGIDEIRTIAISSTHRLIKQWNYYAYILRMLPEVHAADYLYVRYHVPTPAYVKFLQAVNNTMQRGPQIICEVPTYPYSHEFNGIKGRIFQLLDDRFAGRAGEFYDHVVTFYPAKQIFGHKPILLDNAVAQSSIDEGRNFKPTDRSHPDGQIKVIGLAANLERFHGYERALAGLRTYEATKTNEQQGVHLTIISQGSEFERLKKLSIDWSLGDVTTFLPPRVGRDLNDILAKMDIGLGTLARYLANLDTDSSLKSREYCCFGIPLVLAAKDRSFPAGLPFVKYVNNDDSELNFTELCSWLTSLRANPEWRNDMFTYAQNELSWRGQMRKILPVLTIQNTIN